MIDQQREKWRIAADLIRKGDLGTAISILDELIEANPRHRLAMRERGFARQFAGNDAGSIADFTAFIHLHPEDLAGYTRRAAAHEAAGDLAGAIGDYSTATDLNPEHPSAYFIAERRKSDRGDFMSAISGFSADMQYSSHGPASALLARRHAKRHLGDLSGAIGDFTRAMDGKGVEVFAALARASARWESSSEPFAISLRQLKRGPHSRTPTENVPR